MKLIDKHLRLLWYAAMRPTKLDGCTMYELKVLVMWCSNTSRPVNGRPFSMHVRDIAAQSHMSESNARRALKGLCKKGYLYRLSGRYADYALQAAEHWAHIADTGADQGVVSEQTQED